MTPLHQDRHRHLAHMVPLKQRFTNAPERTQVAPSMPSTASP